MWLSQMLNVSENLIIQYPWKLVVVWHFRSKPIISTFGFICKQVAAIFTLGSVAILREILIEFLDRHVAETCLEVCFPSCPKSISYQNVQLTSLFQPFSSLEGFLILLPHCRSFVSQRRPSYLKTKRWLTLRLSITKWIEKPTTSVTGPLSRNDRCLLL